MLKRIWAVISETDFYACQQRAKADGLTLGQALASLTHIYAKGEDVNKVNVKAYANHFDCIKAANIDSLCLEDVEG